MGSKKIVVHSVNDKPWERYPDEPSFWYQRFLTYRDIGPQRTLSRAYRNWLQDVEHKEILPGEPAPALPADWRRFSYVWDWKSRAQAWDDYNFQREAHIREELYRDALRNDIEESLEGYNSIIRMAIKSLYERDENGNIIHDKDGMPVLKLVDDPTRAARIFRQGIEGKRVVLGLPTEYVVASPDELQQMLLSRVKELNNLLEGNDDDYDDNDAE